ncbi:NAD(P)-dependent alcohol dehydrogenase [Hazenella sp. IB182353]|uniref:NAD(P)-dependent alcohol dehydrogenase n=1 Tax=Polycladospora coralii TaxID=2771432 RepID=UPI0017466E53|nr:NAD(P)-dependent alcohol dehydrogenase [Polycladospora coralii]MBS7528921.1 NAD(P)-dependent alcohol dehydrogenase [Polycladospora coralii]
MKSAFLNKDKQLVVDFRSKPKPKSHELLIKVHATSVNPSDWKQMKNFAKLGLSYHAGADFSGVVEEVGEKVTRFKKGDAVFAHKGPGGGAASEYLTVHENHVLSVPDNVSLDHAAGVPTAAITAWHGLITYGNLKPGHKVLIIGASGGVGSYAIQIAKAFDAEVTGVSSGESIEMVKQLGADHVIDYKKNNVVKEERLFGEFDLILDMVSIGHYKEYFPLLAPKGQYVTSVTTKQNFMGKLKGLFSFGRKKANVIFVPTRGLEQLKEIRKLMEKGQIVTPVHDTFTLDDINQAYDLSKSGGVNGKIIIQMVS